MAVPKVEFYPESVLCRSLPSTLPFVHSLSFSVGQPVFGNFIPALTSKILNLFIGDVIHDTTLETKEILLRNNRVYSQSQSSVKLLAI